MRGRCISHDAFADGIKHILGVSKRIKCAVSRVPVLSIYIVLANLALVYHAFSCSGGPCTFCVAIAVFSFKRPVEGERGHYLS